MKHFLSIAAVLLVAWSSSAFAAVSCTLDHPDQDIKRIFPESTTYKVRDLIPMRHGRKDLLATLSKKLRHPLDNEFVTAETPYTFYVIYAGTKYIGLMLGVNARVEGGPLQLFTAYTTHGKIRDLYIQKMASDDISLFRSKYYRNQFSKFDLASYLEEADVLPPARIPSASLLKDHHHFLDAVNLNILIVKYLYNRAQS